MWIETYRLFLSIMSIKMGLKLNYIINCINKKTCIFNITEFVRKALAYYPSVYPIRLPLIYFKVKRRTPRLFYRHERQKEIIKSSCHEFSL